MDRGLDYQLDGFGNSRVSVWDARNGTLKWTDAGFEGTAGVALSGDGRALASGGGASVRLRDVTSGESRGSLDVGDTFNVHGVAMSPDGQSAVGLGERGSIYCWRLHSSSGKGRWDGQPSIKGNYAAFSPDSRTVAVSAMNQVALLDVVGHKPRATLGGQSFQVRCLAFSPEGSTLAGGLSSGRIQLWDTTSLTPMRILQGHTGAVTSLAFAPDGSTLASASNDGTLRLWRLR